MENKLIIISAGAVVLPKAVVNTDTKVGKGCIVNCGSLIDHGCVYPVKEKN